MEQSTASKYLAQGSLVQWEVATTDTCVRLGTCRTGIYMCLEILLEMVSTDPFISDIANFILPKSAKENFKTIQELFVNKGTESSNGDPLRDEATRMMDSILSLYLNERTATRLNHLKLAETNTKRHVAQASEIKLTPKEDVVINYGDEIPCQDERELAPHERDIKLLMFQLLTVLERVENDRCLSDVDKSLIINKKTMWWREKLETDIVEYSKKGIKLPLGINYSVVQLTELLLSIHNRFRSERKWSMEMLVQETKLL